MRCLPWVTLLFPLSLLACRPGSGLNGPRFPSARGGEGPCFEVDLSDGLAGGEEALTAFDCLNGYGAFDPLEPLVTWLATSDQAHTFVTATNETLSEYDVPGSLHTAARLLTSADAPLGQALDVYAEIYDEGLLPPALLVGQRGSAAMVECEDSAAPETCSVPRLARRLIAAGVAQQALDVISTAAEGLAPEEPAEEDSGSAELLLGLLWETSTQYRDEAGQPVNSSNALLALAGFLVSDFALADPKAEIQPPIQHLLPVAQHLLSPDPNGDGDERDDVVRAVADELVPLWRAGALDALPGQMETLYTTNSAGEFVGCGGVTIMDELAAAAQSAGGDPDMLYETVPFGEGGADITVLDFMLETAEDLYAQDADIAEILGTLVETDALVCGEGQERTDSELCDTLAAALPPAQAAVETGIADLALPLLHALHGRADFGLLLDAAPALSEMELAGRTRFLTCYMLENQPEEKASAAPEGDLFPLLVNPALGTLTPLGEQALSLVRTLIFPWDADGGEPVVPALAPLPLVRAALDADAEGGGLDFLLGHAAGLALDPTSPLYHQRLSALADAFSEAMGERDVDPVAAAGDLLANDALWQSLLRLAADEELLVLLTPADGRYGAPWYLYDLIRRGVLGRMLTYAALVIDALVEDGKIEDPWVDTEES